MVAKYSSLKSYVTHCFHFLILNRDSFMKWVHVNPTTMCTLVLLCDVTNCYNLGKILI